jgi:hypothetical protein
MNPSYHLSGKVTNMSHCYSILMVKNNFRYCSILMARNNSLMNFRMTENSNLIVMAANMNYWTILKADYLPDYCCCNLMVLNSCCCYSIVVSNRFACFDSNCLSLAGPSLSCCRKMIGQPALNIFVSVLHFHYSLWSDPAYNPPWEYLNSLPVFYRCTLLKY